jgi:hypothetical protein
MDPNKRGGHCHIIIVPRLIRLWELNLELINEWYVGVIHMVAIGLVVTVLAMMVAHNTYSWLFVGIGCGGSQTNSMISVTTAPNELSFCLRLRGLNPTSQNGEFHHNCVNQLSSPVDAVLMR